MDLYQIDLEIVLHLLHSSEVGYLTSDTTFSKYRYYDYNILGLLNWLADYLRHNIYEAYKLLISVLSYVLHNKEGGHLQELLLPNSHLL